MRRPSCACLLAAASAICLSAHLLAAQSPRTELRGEGFVLRGQVSPDTLTSVACDLARAAKALRPSSVSRVVPRVVAVDSARGIREWLPQFDQRGRGNPLGAYWQGLYGDHIVIRVDAPQAERLRRVLHEYAHFVTHLTHPEPAPWLDEGLSEVWEHATITRNTIEIGRPVAPHLKRLRGKANWIPVRELLAANAVPVHDSVTFYAESWALVHYLLFEKHVGQVVVDRVPDVADLPTDAALKAYIHGPMGAVVAIPSAFDPKRCPAQVTVSQISTLESLVDRAQALADGDRPDAALPVLRAALLLDPQNTETLETIGFALFRENRPVESAAAFDRVIAAGTATHISYYYRAVLSGPVPEMTGGGGSIPQVAYLRRALALNPGFAPAVQRLRELTGKY